MKLLNLGCGSRYHNSWTNVDFVSNSLDVITHNLLQGIPYKNESFEGVYHSHVLEHFNKNDGKEFLKECYRVLKFKGVIRIAVPDLERIVKEYIKNLKLSIEGDLQAQLNYEWIMLELFDQIVRTKSGGDMATYIYQDTLPNENYVFERLGEEAKNLRKLHLNDFDKTKKILPLTLNKSDKKYFRKIKNILKYKLKNILFKEEVNFFEKHNSFRKLGEFRLGGEIHQWMYDKYSLSKLLRDIGFKNIEVKTAFDSKISNWNKYQLDSKDNIIFKPDSLFIEAIK
ncbi:hypothetical protein A5893_14440 [Pedobacter psychrophilus]|uniref:Methyltransferase type 11 domain-containing protein n=1 Tax=Pedobacter psychrophilus TaxID=1826909 RepID=A0A179DCA4_9SPHI|nr:methyltransferase domain-containing protein [Pedobacter psychrophilus]OAQ38608.1 hypothetical protein A5893_14440 [Pedobacter psychrophilus]